MKQNLSSSCKFILFGNFIANFGVFICMPFFTLYLKNAVELSDAMCGVIVGAPFLCSAFLGVLGGKLGDKFGAKKSIIISLLLFIICFLVYPYIQSFKYFIVIAIFLGTARSLLEPNLKKMLSIFVEEENRLTAFRIRYMAICIAAIFGPMIGMFLYKVSHALLFSTTACIFFFYLLLCLYYLPNNKDIADHEKNKFNLWEILANNKNVTISILLGTLVFVNFSLLDTIFPLVLNQYEINGTTLFTVLIILNAVLGLLLQGMSNYLFGKLNLQEMVLAGGIFFSTAFVLFCLALDIKYIYFIAIIFFTLGEVVLFPAIEVLIDKSSSYANKGIIFGAAEIRQSGFFIGPALGGYILQMAGVNLFYIFFAASIFIGCFISYKKISI